MSPWVPHLNRHLDRLVAQKRAFDYVPSTGRFGPKTSRFDLEIVGVEALT
jgi:hypothetical protein